MKHLVLLALVAMMAGCTKYDPRVCSNKLNPIIRIASAVKYCSAFVINDRFALTAAHCLDPGDKFLVYSATGQLITTAEAYSAYRTLDYGAITGDFSRFSALALATQFACAEHIPSLYFACGYPGGQRELACTTVRTTNVDTFAVLGIGAGYPGMSGGPVINTATQKVEGVVSAMKEDKFVIAPLVNPFEHLRLLEVH